MTEIKTKAEVLTANQILNALIAYSDDKIWASELAFLGGARRIDFFTLEVAASKKFRTSSYEIKVSRADYNRDTLEKQTEALRYSDRFWYVTPPNMISKAEIPSWAGHQVWDGKSFTVNKRAPKLERGEPTWELIVSLLRNSGDCRRDVGLMKSQISWLQYEASKVESQKRISNERFMQKLMRRGGIRSL